MFTRSLYVICYWKQLCVFVCTCVYTCFLRYHYIWMCFCDFSSKGEKMLVLKRKYRTSTPDVRVDPILSTTPDRLFFQPPVMPGNHKLSDNFLQGHKLSGADVIRAQSEQPNQSDLSQVSETGSMGKCYSSSNLVGLSEVHTTSGGHLPSISLSASSIFPVVLWCAVFASDVCLPPRSSLPVWWQHQFSVVCWWWNVQYCCSQCLLDSVSLDNNDGFLIMTLSV